MRFCIQKKKEKFYILLLDYGNVNHLGFDSPHNQSSKNGSWGQV